MRKKLRARARVAGARCRLFKGVTKSESKPKSTQARSRRDVETGSSREMFNSGVRFEGLGHSGGFRRVDLGGWVVRVTGRYHQISGARLRAWMDVDGRGERESDMGDGGTTLFFFVSVCLIEVRLRLGIALGVRTRVDNERS